jgi:hypothetical protein
MRKLIIILLGASVVAATAIAAALAQGGGEPSSDVSTQGVSDAARVAAALELSEPAKATLAEAQALGREATACLIANGASQAADGALVDTGGEAADACAAELEANEAFLASEELAAVLEAVQPKFEAAAECFSDASGLAPGTVLDPEALTSEQKELLDEAWALCYTPDGLPR